MNDIEIFLETNQTFNAEENEFFTICEKYFTKEEVKLIKKAYIAAKDLHRGQLRDSGENYITHPLRVARILLEEIKLIDVNSICAALLHDTIEDVVGITKEFIEEYFNMEIASLVDGVTKIKDIKFSSKDEKDLYNNAIMLRKIINNPKILLIKLADRIHNMRTLEYKHSLPGENKQMYKALETSNFFLPLANLIGMREIREELEERCFYFLSGKEYLMTESNRSYYLKNNQEKIEEVKKQIEELLHNANLNVNVEIKYLNIYETYLMILKYKKFSLIPNFFTINIITQNKEDCYTALRILSTYYKEINDLKDMIKEPRINGFRALSFNTLNEVRPITFEIATNKMDMINRFGYAGLFSIHDDAVVIDKIINETSFMQILSEISTKYQEDEMFYREVNKELFVPQIRVYTPKGKMIWLPLNSKVIDFAYKIHTDLGKNATCAIVNDKEVPLDFPLKDGDKVTILTRKEEYKLTRKK